MIRNIPPIVYKIDKLVSIQKNCIIDFNDL
jgi:hypothetical protein